MSDSTAKKKLTFTHIGYNAKSVNCSVHKKYIIRLTSKATVLSEVTITPKKSILEQAIERIPLNYSTRPILQTGLIRLHTIMNDCGFFFKGDALVELYTPAYSGTLQKQSIKILHNTRTLIDDKNSKCLQKYAAEWVGSYSTIEDIVFDRPGFMTTGKLDNYLYYYKPNIDYKGRRTHVINFVLRKGREEGVIYIDSITKAFSRIEYTMYNVQKLFYGTRDIVKGKFEYSLQNAKWYIDKTRIHVTYNNLINAVEIQEFQSTGMDSINVKPIPYSEKVQFVDRVTSILKKDPAGKGCDSLISKYERDSTFTVLPIPKTDTSHFNRRAVIKKVLTFLTTIKPSVAFKNAPFTSGHYPRYLPNTFGLGLSFPVYKNLSIRWGRYKNYGIGQFKIQNDCLSIESEISFNRNHRRIRIIPHVGISKLIVEEKSTRNRCESANYAAGVRFAIEIRRGMSFFIDGEYLKPYKSNYEISDLTFREMSFSTGLMFHLKQYK